MNFARGGKIKHISYQIDLAFFHVDLDKRYCYFLYNVCAVGWIEFVVVAKHGSKKSHFD
jgi:hypothetical protein